MQATRRELFKGVLGGIAAAFALDPEKLLWVPGKKLISLAPNTTLQKLLGQDGCISCHESRLAIRAGLAKDWLLVSGPRFEGEDPLSDKFDAEKAHLWINRPDDALILMPLKVRSLAQSQPIPKDLTIQAHANYFKHTGTTKI